jgi:cation-transporting ATPase 13A1
MAPETRLDPAVHRLNILFAGTTIEQIIPSHRPDLPTQGTLCRVLATGLGSAQGKLIRTISYTTDRFSVDNRDSLYLLLFLTVFCGYGGLIRLRDWEAFGDCK